VNRISLFRQRESNPRRASNGRRIVDWACWDRTSCRPLHSLKHGSPSGKTRADSAVLQLKLSSATTRGRLMPKRPNWRRCAGQLQHLDADHFTRLSAFLRDPTWESTNNAAERGGRAFRYGQHPHFRLRSATTIDADLKVRARTFSDSASAHRHRRDSIIVSAVGVSTGRTYGISPLESPNDARIGCQALLGRIRWRPRLSRP
jgi:hypothetical protein